MLYYEAEEGRDMPAVLEQINGMSVSEKMRIMTYLMRSIEQAVAQMESAEAAHRVLTPDPALHCEIKCDLFEDDSSQWENA